MATTDQQLASALLRTGVVTVETIQTAAQRREGAKSLAQTLLEMGVVTREQLERIDPDSAETAEQEQEDGRVHVDLRRYPIQENAVRLLPRDRAVALQAIPLEVRENCLRVAMADPGNLGQVEEIARITGMRVDAVGASAAMVLEAIDRVYVAAERADQGTTDVKRRTPALAVEYSEEAPSVRVVDAILSEAIAQAASDIHLEPRSDGCYLRYRIDGLLRPPTRMDKAMQSAMVSRLKVLAGMDIAENRLPQDGRFRLAVRGRVVDFRVSTLPTYHGEKVVLRILDRATVLIGLDQLGMLADARAAFEELILRPQGMILVTGPTGSGKSTTLYGALNRAKSETKNVVTVEDPIEYQVEGINQTTINQRIDLTFARQLRAILRQDPDVILVGEIRDRETAEMAFRAALTGHLVLSTLHTNDAPSAMTRLVDMGIEPYLIASSVMAVLAQRLVRVNCDQCKQPYQSSEVEMARIGLTGPQAREFQFVRGTGCPACGHTGYRGRSGIYELMLVNEPIRQALMKGEPASRLRQMAIRQGMRALREDGIEKVKQGLTTLEEVARVIYAFTEDAVTLDDAAKGNRPE